MVQHIRNIDNILKKIALSRRFQKIDVEEPTPDQAFQILNGLKQYFEDHHDTKYTVKQSQASIDLSVKHIHDRKLPDKAIDVIDEAGAAQMILPEKKERKLLVSEIENVIAKLLEYLQENQNRCRNIKQFR